MHPRFPAHASAVAGDDSQAPEKKRPVGQTGGAWVTTKQPFDVLDAYTASSMCSTPYTASAVGVKSPDGPPSMPCEMAPGCRRLPKGPRGRGLARRLWRGLRMAKLRPA